MSGRLAPARPPLSLPVRNRLAELILEAFDGAEPRATLLAVARAAGAPRAAVDAADRQRLLALEWFETAGETVRLRGGLRAQGLALAERAGRGARVVGAWADPGGDELVRLLSRAAALAEAGLFFEVHELLEPAWFQAVPPLRTALQGLIQVAVAFHHLDQDNRAGALALLAEGHAKLAAAPGALPVALAPWLGELARARAAIARGEAIEAVPPWPRPAAAAAPVESGDRGEGRWHCC